MPRIHDWPPCERDQQVSVFGIHRTQTRAFEPGAREPFAQRRNRIRRARGAERIEIFDDDRAPAVLQRACDLAERRSGTLRSREDAIDGHRVEQRARERQVVHVATLQLAVTEPGAVNVGTRQPQRIARNVDADRSRRMRTEQLEQMARAGADIEQHADRLVRQLAQDDRIDGARRSDARLRGQLIRRATRALANHLLHALAVPSQ